ncbi:hypothetical protein F4803DRAFT_252114 [Xylaria telfairii]|nr:hypothetical protein F4803DRAFT_252114 [Xylaria telfairii]
MSLMAGLATGVISLGLQVAGGLSNYLDAVKGRSEELSLAKQEATNMKDLILTIQDLLPQVKTTSPTSATLIDRHVQSCNTEIGALQGLLSELSQPASSSSGIRLKLAEHKQKLTYPFNRTHLSRLEERLVKVNSTLQTALNATGLDVSITTRNELRQVHDSTITTRNELQKVHDSTITMKNQVQQLHSLSMTTGNELQRMHDNFVATGDQVQQTHDFVINTGEEVRQVHDKIRQMHDELRAMYQSTTVRTQSTAYSSAASRIPQAMVKGGAGVPLDSIEAAVSLASKPSLLSTSIETVTKYTLLSPPRNGSLACICRPSHKSSYYWKSCGYFSFSYGTLDTQKHMPSCPLSRIDGKAQTTNFNLEYSGLKRLLQKAFVVSFTTSYGAGGRSIEPSFAYYPAIDEKIAPAFRIIQLVYYMFRAHQKPTSSDAAKVLRQCFNNILKLYSRGRASPRDINSYGDSIIYSVVDIFSCEWPPVKDRLVLDSIFSGVSNMIACGVPVATTKPWDDMLSSIPALAIARFAADELLNITHTNFIELANLLIPAASDAPLVHTREPVIGVTNPVYGRIYLSPHLLTMAIDNVRYIKILSQHLTLAEASGCGPLSLATIAGDKRLAQEILLQYPESVREVNCFGLTPIHFAVKHPALLALMVKMAGSSIVELSDVGDPTPLEFAYLGGHKEATKILIASKSGVYLRYLFYVHESCREELFVALKQRRDELKQLALSNLTSTEAKSLRLHDNTVLDDKAFQVQELLQRRGVNIPSHLFLGPWRETNSVYARPRWYPRSPSARINLDQLWALGFRDIDCFDDDGRLPLIEHSNLNVVRWLIEHGADYWTPLSARSDSPRTLPPITPAHYIFSTIGSNLFWEHGRILYPDAGPWLIQKLLHVRVTDTCSCLCSGGGCVPATGLFTLIRFTHNPLFEKNHMYGWVKVIRAFDASLNKDDLILLVRHMTFNALGLKHTCCESRFYKRRQYTSEDIYEINSEQSALLSLFADLVDEFAQVAFEDQGGKPLIVSDPEEFWIHRWLPRITETLENLDGDDLTQEEISAAEAIGVVWGPRPVQTTVCEDDNHYEYNTPEWVMREMEKIMNE